MINDKKVEQITDVNQEKQEKFIGRLSVPHKGMKLFSFNKETKEVNEVEIIRDVSFDPINKKELFNSKIKIDKTLYYEFAINKKNAIKKFKKYE